MAEYTLWNGSIALLLTLLSNVSLTFTSSVSGCNDTGNEINLYNGTLSGNLTSPNYPEWAPGNSSCVWVLNCSPGRIVKLYFHELIFDKSSKNYSHLQIHDGTRDTSPMIINFTAGESNFSISKPSMPIYYSSGTKMSLHLKKASAMEVIGNFRFLVSYRSIKPGETCSASNSVDENNNILLKPPVGFTLGKDLPPQVDCTWKITPITMGSQIEFTVEIDKEMFCRAGNAYIFDGPYGSASKMRKNICRKQVEEASFSFENGLSFQLKSSNFSSVLQVKASEDDCVLTHRNFYATKSREKGKHLSNIRCQRKFSTPYGFPLMFNLLVVLLSNGCEESSVQLFELHKHSNKSTLRAEFCKTAMIFPLLVIYSGQAMIKIKAVHSNQNKQFYFGTFFFSAGPRYISRRSYCSQYNSPEENTNLTLTARKGTFFTPNHLFGASRPYPPGMVCRWILLPINMTDKEQIQIEIRSFDFSNGNDKDCNQDNVQLDFSDGKVERYCRTNVPPSVIYSGDAKTVNITFVAKPLFTENVGFIADYKVVKIVAPPRPYSWTVVGVLIACGFLLLACVAFGIYRCKKKRKHEREVQRMLNETDGQDDTCPEELQGPPPPYEGKQEDSFLAQHPTEEQPFPWFSAGTTITEHSSRERRPGLEMESEI